MIFEVEIDENGMVLMVMEKETVDCEHHGEQLTIYDQDYEDKICAQCFNEAMLGITYIS